MPPPSSLDPTNQSTNPKTNWEQHSYHNDQPKRYQYRTHFNLLFLEQLVRFDAYEIDYETILNLLEGTDPRHLDVVTQMLRRTDPIGLASYRIQYIDGMYHTLPNRQPIHREDLP